jgi:hypothetical protein
MNNKELESIIKLDPQKRYSYFIKRVSDLEKIWVLYSDDLGFAVNDVNQKKYLYLFPFEEYAKHFQKEENSFLEFTTKEIDLYLFKDELIPKFKKKDVYSAFVFPVPNGFGYNISFDNLIRDIDNEIEENY